MGVGRRRAQAVAFIVVDMQDGRATGLGQSGGQTAGHVRGPERVGAAVAEEDGAGEALDGDGAAGRKAGGLAVPGPGGGGVVGGGAAGEERAMHGVAGRESR